MTWVLAITFWLNLTLFQNFNFTFILDYTVNHNCGQLPFSITNHNGRCHASPSGIVWFHLSCRNCLVNMQVLWQFQLAGWETNPFYIFQRTKIIWQQLQRWPLRPETGWCIQFYSNDFQLWSGTVGPTDAKAKTNTYIYAGTRKPWHRWVDRSIWFPCQQAGCGWLHQLTRGLQLSQGSRTYWRHRGSPMSSPESHCIIHLRTTCIKQKHSINIHWFLKLLRSALSASCWSCRYEAWRGNTQRNTSNDINFKAWQLDMELLLLKLSTLSSYLTRENGTISHQHVCTSQRLSNINNVTLVIVQIL